LHFLDSAIVDYVGDAFVAKVDSGGQLQWVDFAGPNVTELATLIQGLTWDHDNRLEVLIGVPIPGEVYAGYNCPTRGTYVFKIDTLGNVLSSDFLTDMINSLTFWSMAVDDSNNTYMSLYFESDTIQFGGQQILKQGTYQFNLLFIKLDSLNDMQWYVQMGDTYPSLGYGVQTDTLNDVYFTGLVRNGKTLQGHVFNNPLGGPNVDATFVAKFSPSGTLIWADNTQGQYSTPGYGKLVRKNTGELYFSGIFGNLAQFGSTTLNSVNFRDIYLAEVSPGGVIQSATTFTTTGTKPYPSVTQVDNAGNVYVGGSFDGTITINGVTQVNQGGRSNGFIAKYGFPCTTGIGEESSGSSSNNLKVYPNPAINSVNISFAGIHDGEVLELSNLMGEVVFRKTISTKENGEIGILLNDFTPGMYIIRFQTQSGIYISSFVKI